MSDQLQVWHCLEGSGPVQSHGAEQQPVRTEVQAQRGQVAHVEPGSAFWPSPC